MAYAEKRGNLWRARWRGPDGILESKPGFRTRKDAGQTESPSPNGLTCGTRRWT